MNRTREGLSVKKTVQRIFSLIMRTVKYNQSLIEYTLTRKRVKNLNLRIKPDGSVNVSAPAFVSVKQIDAFVLANAEKILSAQKRFEEKNKMAYELKTGEKVTLLGNEYYLHIREWSKDYYYFNNGSLVLFVRDSDVFENRQAVFTELCRDLAKHMFPSIFKSCYKNFTDVCPQMPELKIRNMKSQWGNCRPQKNVITLSLRLVQFDSETVRFVINHEFCHFYEQNHSKDFYSHLAEVEPEWKKYDAVLKGK